VLRFRLTVKRGPRMRPQASEGEAQHRLFWGIGRFGRTPASALWMNQGRMMVQYFVKGQTQIRGRSKMGLAAKLDKGLPNASKRHV
jgi:hypothetical protein